MGASPGINVFRLEARPPLTKGTSKLGGGGMGGGGTDSHGAITAQCALFEALRAFRLWTGMQHVCSRHTHTHTHTHTACTAERVGHEELER